MPFLYVKNLSLSFDGIKAIDDLSFEVEKGTITAIIGPNGSGKTSLMNVLTGWYVSSRGLMLIGTAKRQRIRREECHELGIARTFQESRLFAQMTVMDNLLLCLTQRLPFSALRSKGEVARQEVEEVLKQVALEGKRDDLAAALSYGQKKLLELARVILLKSEIILLDEPFAGLFPDMVQRFVQLIQSLKQQGKTILLIEHNMSLIRELADQVVVLDSGSLLAQGTPKEVMRDRRVIEAYLGD